MKHIANILALPGERMQTKSGNIVTIVGRNQHGQLLGIGPFDHLPVPVNPVTNAFGGEHDMEIGLAA